MRPRLLDLFAGAGGCTVGYQRAGFHVLGVDNVYHADYPANLIVDDAMNVLSDTAFLATFDVIHASPPCPRFSSITPADRRDTHPDLLTPTLAALAALPPGVEWVVENVPGAPMPDPVTICGPAMGLPGIRRHRLFSSSVLLLSPGCACTSAQPYGIYGDHGQVENGLRPDGTSRGRKARDAAHARELLGIDWMTRWDDLTDAIPPAYTHHIGTQLLAHLGVSA